MQEIKCPKCGEIIQIGKDEYNSILQDIEQSEINQRVNERVKEIEEKYHAQLQLESNTIKSNQEKTITELSSQIAILKEQINSKDKDTQLAIADATEKLKNDLSEKEIEIAQLNSDLNQSKSEIELSNKRIKEQYEFQLQAKEEEIKHWKEFRIGDSTKDIGESLEQYCHDAFDEIRAYAYPNAYFEKDNQAVEGTKGDFIFRDYSDDDLENEMVSIMFEMKNQKEDGDTKNEQHLKKLDNDRNKKKCEYAVLVSTLEPESKLYNSGIVDMSHKFDKMFVIRPQFFLTIIGLIKNMAKSRFEYKRQVIEYQRQNTDITNFEESVKAVAAKISKDYEFASKQYESVEKMCDDMIKKLTEFKETFRLGKHWIEVAQNQIPELEVRKLTKNNPTMRQKFEELKDKDNE